MPKLNDRRPNTIPLSERVFNLLLALVLVSAGAVGLIQGQLEIAPPKSKVGVVLYGRPLWLLAASLFTGAVVLLSVVVDHYDKRANEHWYQSFKRAAVLAGMLLLLSSCVSGFYVGLVH